MAVLLFLLGLDALEPLSQEIDHPGLTDGYPVEPARLHLWLLAAPAVALVPFAMVGALVVALLEPPAAGAAFALAVPIAWAGATGSVVNAVRDAAPPVAASSGFAPPEFAGFGNAMRAIVPLLISSSGAVVVLAMRTDATAATAVRSVVGVALVLGAIGWWVRRHEVWRQRWTSFLEGARP